MENKPLIIRIWEKNGYTREQMLKKCYEQDRLNLIPEVERLFRTEKKIIMPQKSEETFGKYKNAPDRINIRLEPSLILRMYDKSKSLGFKHMSKWLRSVIEKELDGETSDD